MLVRQVLSQLSYAPPHASQTRVLVYRIHLPVSTKIWQKRRQDCSRFRLLTPLREDAGNGLLICMFSRAGASFWQLFCRYAYYGRLRQRRVRFPVQRPRKKGAACRRPDPLLMGYERTIVLSINHARGNQRMVKPLARLDGVRRTGTSFCAAFPAAPEAGWILPF